MLSLRFLAFYGEDHGPESRRHHNLEEFRRDIENDESKIPAIFHACRDSREAAIKECSPRFFQSQPCQFTPPEAITTCFLHAIRRVPLFGELRHMELQGSEFDGSGYSHRQATILKAMPALEKLTLHGDQGFIMEYWSDKDKRQNETLLQFWTRKRGIWRLCIRDYTVYEVNNEDHFPEEICSPTEKKTEDWYQSEYSGFLNLVDDGLFCDNALTSSIFESEQNAMMKQLNSQETYKWRSLIRLSHFPPFHLHDNRPQVRFFKLFPHTVKLMMILP